MDGCPTHLARFRFWVFKESALSESNDRCKTYLLTWQPFVKRGNAVFSCTVEYSNDLVGCSVLLLNQ